MKNKGILFGIVPTVFAAVLAVVIIAVNSLLCIYTDIHPAFIGVMSNVAFIALVAGFAVIYKNTFLQKRKAPVGDTANALAYAIIDLPHPAFICHPDDTDVIIWCNRKANELFGKKSDRSHVVL